MFFRCVCVISLVTGTMFLMWLGEQITERYWKRYLHHHLCRYRGEIFRQPSAALFQLVSTGAISPPSMIFIIAIVVLVTAFVVFVERGQRRITVNYAKRQIGNKVYGGQSSYLPLKINMANVIPPIFASSFDSLPCYFLAGWFTSGDSTRWIRDLAASLSPGQPLYTLLLRSFDYFLLLTSIRHWFSIRKKLQRILRRAAHSFQVSARVNRHHATLIKFSFA